MQYPAGKKLHLLSSSQKHPNDDATHTGDPLPWHGHLTEASSLQPELPVQQSLISCKKKKERKFNLSIQPALAYEDVSMLESSAKLRMAAKQ